MDVDKKLPILLRYLPQGSVQTSNFKLRICVREFVFARPAAVRPNVYREPNTSSTKTITDHHNLLMHVVEAGCCDIY